jgi:tetratricopeptide (TPR) repeat protein
VAAESDDPEIRREALLLAGDLYDEAGAIDQALAAYGRYLDAFPWPLDVAQETRFKMAGMHQGRGEQNAYHEMLASIVASDATAGADRTDRSRYLAARSALVLTEGQFAGFAEVELTQPFEDSLARKRERMDETLAAFEGLVAYEVSEVTAAATWYVAEIYLEFSRSLLESERPEGLSAAELLDYELAIEEEAFPFEERAITVHEDNFALVAAGVFNPWVERSLAKLAVMMPGRYAKPEISSGYMGAIDFYSYRSPGAPPEEIVSADRSPKAGRTESTVPPTVARATGSQDRTDAERKPAGDSAAADGATALSKVLAERRRGDYPEIEFGDVWFTITEQMRIGSDAREDYGRALGLLRQSRFDEGIALLETVTASTPELTAPYIDLGIAYGQAGNVERAEAALSAAGLLSPGNPIVHNELGILYRRTGRFAEARASYDRALSEFGEFHYARRNLAVLCDLYLADSACALANYRAYLASVGSDAEVEIWVADLENRAARQRGQ